MSLWYIWMSGLIMFSCFSNYNSVVSLIYNYIICVFSYYYLLILMCVFGLFIMYRFPYCYSPYLFVCVLLVLVFSSFVTLFTSRIFDNFNEFFSSFIPVGTPIYICPLVCIAETISYIIRPIVLILRPFINISLGCFGTVAVCNLFIGSLSLVWFSLLFILFFYEVFVAVVHWYIVSSILSFSIDH